MGKIQAIQQLEQRKDYMREELESARRVLAGESQALTALSQSLGADFVLAVDQLDRVHDSKGRVVVTGMGKSGHIGRKIAATMASTGTPAIYVHPGEASHGDLGMITRDDVILAISNSGETKELSDILAFSKRHTIMLIGITSGQGSTLDNTADISLLLPPEPEMCPMGLAPTTSTTMTLALGDALAIAAMERRGFTAEQFRGFHPGGKLGNILIKVKDLMHHGDGVLPLIPANMMMPAALDVMSAKKFGCVAIIDAEQTLLGIITDGDLRRNLSRDLVDKTVGEVMTKDPKTITPDALAAEALSIMNSKSITSLLVVDEANIVRGLIHIHDLLRAGVM